jgi:hypothetical protein
MLFMRKLTPSNLILGSIDMPELPTIQGSLDGVVHNEERPQVQVLTHTVELFHFAQCWQLQFGSTWLPVQENN